MDQFVTNEISVQGAPSFDLFWRCDWRVIFLLLKRWSLVLLAVLVVITAGTLTFLKRKSLHSMRRWQAEVKLFHQIRSERVPSFYKQIDTKVIAEIIGNGTQLRKVAERLQLPASEVAALGGLIEVELVKNRPSVITVRASYSDAKMSAALANAVADEGLNAYIELQNGTLQGMLMERRQRRIRLQDSLYELEKTLANFSVPGSLLRPDKEMDRLSTEITALMMQLAVDETEVVRLGVVIEETKTAMAGVDKEVKMLSRIYGNDDTEIARLQGRLVSMMQQYTENNPQVRVLRDEIEGKRKLFEESANKEKASDEIVYTINSVYTTLEQRLLQAQIDRIALTKRVEVQTSRLDGLRKVMTLQQDMAAGFQEVQRKMNSITTGITQLDGTINDMELLLNSAVPDLSILDTASAPRAPSVQTKKIVALAGGAGFFTVILLMVMLIGHEVIFGTVKSSRDFHYVCDMDELGMLPEGSEVGPYVLDAALHNVFIQMRMRFGEGRRIFLCQMSPNPMINQLRASWNVNFGTNGLQVFWLKCLSITAREELHEKTGAGKDRAPDEGMVAIDKYGNHGYFYCENPLVLTPAEWELLNADLVELEKNFGVVVIERDMPKMAAGVLSEQFCRMVDYTVVLATFGIEKKFQLKRLLSDERLSGIPVGGIMTGVKKTYWRIFMGDNRM